MRGPRKRIHTVVLDWDGTLVENKWPDMGDWMPGAVKACKRMHHAGVHLVVFSARLNPYDPFTMDERLHADVHSSVMAVRHKLDSAGLTYVEIWTLPGKPGGSVYVDDRAERYGGRTKSWDKLAEKILLRLGEDDPMLPAFDQKVSEYACD